ncbi:MAG: hypothetical protein IT323_17040, partial [Anaerolineae bacterium]|nr:hypothetical protein [Anaerolineae bacterium]
LDRALENPAAAAHFTAQRPIEDCPLSMALDALANCPAQQAQEEIVHWLSAQIRPTSTMKACLKKPPTLYATGEVARQYAYLLTAISALAARLGYSGLAVLIDESEHYSLLRPAQRERADSFFKALIHAAVGPAASRIDVDGIPNHTRADYPTSFSENSHLFFEFASTEGEGRMPIEAWLAPSQIIRLDDRFLKEDIEKFLKMVLRYHSVAYRYGSPPRERYENLLHQASTALSRTLSQHRLNIRELIRLTVTICDLMYVYPDYAPDQIHAELLKGLGIS